MNRRGSLGVATFWLRDKHHAQVAAEGARDYYEDADALAYLGTAVLANRGRDPL
jgi:hypothetical protein